MTDNTRPRLTDDDKGEITVTLDGRELRGWSYANDSERRTKMLCAREYIEGWYDGREQKPMADIEASARTLIGIVRRTERAEGNRAVSAELSLEVSLTGGGVETWAISVERTASSH